MDVLSAPRRAALQRLPQGLRPRGPRSHAVILAAALALPAAQTAQAVDIYYARAIGQEYLPEPAPPKAAAPEAASEKARPDLPALGTNEEENQAPAEGMGLWSKVLIGTLVVAAIAALGNNGGGGSAGVTVGTGGAPAPDNSGPGGGSGGGSGGGGDSGSGGGNGGSGGIDVGIGIGTGGEGNRGNNRERRRGNSSDD